MTKENGTRMKAANENRRLRPSVMDRDEFVGLFGSVFEHSPWVAERAFAAGLSDANDVLAGLHSALYDVVIDAGRETQLELLRAHPELAGRLSAQGGLTQDSSTEQAGAGLDDCTAEELAAFRELNASYRLKFGFPFIIAVRGMKPGDILAAFRKRIANDAETEFAEALKQVGRIARLRLEALFAQDRPDGQP
ncbi:MAG: 2-oxo-4-hydroxy-4-carboxy-5-ureidoimidazoline decarboxylase [Rhodospirillaceae bacterium]